MWWPSADMVLLHHRCFLLRPMQSDAPHDETLRIHPRVAFCFQQRRKIVYGNKRTQRVWNVSIDSWTAVQDCTPKGALGIEIPEVGVSKCGIGRQEEVEAHKLPTRFSHARNFAHRMFQIGEVP